MDFHDEWMNRLAFHLYGLYGFGEQAEALGDHATKERAFAVGEMVLGENTYHDIVQRRIDVDGRFRIDAKDLS